MATPAAWAVGLLRLGSVPFAVALVWASIAPEAVAPLRQALVALAGAVLAFVGGAQQAAAVADGSPAAAALVPAGVAAALVAAAAAWRCAAAPDDAPRCAEVLAAAYAVQACLEARHPAWRTRAARLVAARAPSMALAVAALGACGRPGAAGPAFVAAVAVAALGRPRPARPRRPAFDRVAVGSAHPVKVRAGAATVADYGDVVAAGAPVGGFDVASGVADQPIGLDTVAAGARARAAAAHARAGGGAATLAFGLESGLFEVAGRHLDACVCAAFDGNSHSLGVSCAFEIPPDVLRHVLDDGMDLSQAANAAGLARDAKLGAKGGLIAILTRDRVTRTDYTAQAVRMALAPVEHRLPPPREA